MAARVAGKTCRREGCGSHLSDGMDEKPLQPPGPKPPRPSSGFPHPRRRVALAEPEAALAASSTPPSGCSSPPPATLRPRQLYSSRRPLALAPRRHAGPTGPLWPALEGRRFRISTAPVSLPGPARPLREWWLLPAPARPARAQSQISKSLGSEVPTHGVFPPRPPSPTPQPVNRRRLSPLQLPPSPPRCNRKEQNKTNPNPPVFSLPLTDEPAKSNDFSL